MLAAPAASPMATPSPSTPRSAPIAVPAGPLHAASFTSTSSDQGGEPSSAMGDAGASTSSLGIASSYSTSSPNTAFGLPKQQHAASAIGSGSTTTGKTTTTTNGGGENSNMVLLPNGAYGPRNPILLNPLKKQGILDQWRNEFGNVGPALTVLRIPAVPTQKEREKEREEQRAQEALAREREKEMERERAREREREAEERVWGIPKKAFYLGLGDINFNSQMAMLGGWGSGTGPATDFRPTQALQRRASAGGRSSKDSARPTSKDGRPMSKDGRSKEKRVRDREREKEKEKEKEKEREKEKENERLEKEQKEREQQEEEEDKPMDPEELAALNAIINTRRSMAAAQALASGQVKPTPSRRSMSYGRSGSASTALGTSVQSTRPDLSETRDDSRESVPSVSAKPEDGSSVEKATESSEVFEDEGPRIRFAPLPLPYGGVIDGEAGYEGSAGPINIESRQAALADGDAVSISDDESDSDGSDDDEGWNRRWSTLGVGKGKWYLMGMPSSVFKPQNYRSSLKRMSTGSGATMDPLEGELPSADIQERRMSTGALSTSPSEAIERRGRRKQRPRGRTSSRASSVKSRSSSVGSMDEEDRLRRRELIRASRPGGTGMVTLPDGTRIKARRVGQQQGDAAAADPTAATEEPHDDFIEWGFAGLAREARREHKHEEAADADADADAGEPQRPGSATGDKRASDDEGGRSSDVDDGSGMAWVKRRRREREESRTSADAADSPPPQTAHDEQEQHFREHSDEGAATAKTSASVPVPALSVSPADQDGEEIPVVAQDSVEDLASKKPPQAVPPPTRVERPLAGAKADAPTRSQTLDRTATMPKLSAQQAAEVRRRHEEEVAALGAEVLDHIAKQKAKAQQQQHQQQQQQQQPHHPQAQHQMPEQQASQPQSLPQHRPAQPQAPSMPIDTASVDKGPKEPVSKHMERKLPPPRRESAFAKLRRGSYSSNQSNESNARGSKLNSRTMSKDSSEDKASTPKRVGTPTGPSSSSSPRARSLPRVHQPGGPSLTGLNVTSEPDDMEELLNSTMLVHDELSAPASASMDKDFGWQQQQQQQQQPTQISSSDRKHAALLERTPSSATASTDLSSNVSSSLEDHRPSTSVVSTSPSARLSPNKDTHALSSLRKSISATRLSSPSETRLFADPSISLPVPSRLLPRRPDARGYAVVPLPGDQLGIRPNRPREGRVWLFDSDEDSDVNTSSGEDEDVTEDGTAMRRKGETGAASAAGHEEEEEDDDMDAEELAEEERRTAMQKKRATTRAAGAEVVSTMGKQPKESRQSPRSRSYGPSSSSRTTDLDDLSPTRDAASRRAHRRDGHSSKHHDEAPMSLSPLPRSAQSYGGKDRNPRRPSSTQPRLKSAVSTGTLERKSSRKDPWNDFSDNDDNVTPSRRHSSERDGKEALEPSYDDDSELWPPTLSQTLDRASAKRVSHAIALRHASKAKQAREKRLKEEREKEKERIRKLKENDEYLDYGWPRSLQGSSLY